MARFLPPVFCENEEVRARVRRTFRPAEWLTDESISVIFRNMKKEGGCRLPDSLLVLPPSTAFLLAVADSKMVPQVVASLESVDHRAVGGAAGVTGRSLVICPVSDSVSGHSDSGTHWTLLVAFRRATTGHRGKWSALHFDSLRQARAANCERASLLTNRLFGSGVQMEQARCGKQDNAFDCGLFVACFALEVVDAFLRAEEAKKFALDCSWRARIVETTVKQIARLRAQLFRKCAVPALAAAASQDDSMCCGKCGAVLFGGNEECLNPDCAGKVGARTRPIASGGQGAATRKGAGSAVEPWPATARGTKRLRSVAKAAGERGSSQQYPWSPAYSYHQDGGQKQASRGNVFRRLEQDDYVTICSLKGDAAKAELRKHCFLPPLPPQVTRSCWKCGQAMKKTAFQDMDDVLRCSNVACRTWYNGATAYTPLHGAEVTHEQYLRISYCFSLQCRVDQTVLLSAASENVVSRIFACHRDVLAWFMEELGRGMRFETGEVDLDASKSHVQRSKDVELNYHVGRIFLMKERATGRTKAVPLRDVPVRKGDALPPESLADIQHAVLSSLRDGAIAGGDGGRAIKSAVAKAGVPLATALHGRKPHKQFSKLQIFKKADVSDKLVTVLDKMGRVSCSSESIRVAGGNQGAEGSWGCGRSGMQGRAVHRGGASQHSTSHGMCSLFLSHNPGLAKLGAAHASFIRAHMNTVRPGGFFQRGGWSGSKDSTGELQANPDAVAQARVVKKRPAGSARGSCQKKPAGSVDGPCKKKPGGSAEGR